MKSAIYNEFREAKKTCRATGPALQSLCMRAPFIQITTVKLTFASQNSRDFLIPTFTLHDFPIEQSSPEFTLLQVSLLPCINLQTHFVSNNAH